MNKNTIRRFAACAAAVVAICAATAPSPSFADAVTDTNDVSAVVAGWQSAREALCGQLTAEPASVKAYSGLGGTGTYYVVTLEGGGFVVTSGDTSLEPVLAYSKTGEWVDDVKRNPLMAMLEIDVAAASAGLAERSSAIKSRKLLLATSSGSASATASSDSKTEPSAANQAKWAKYKAASGGTQTSSFNPKIQMASAPSSDLRVGNLVQSAWGQSTVNYFYNVYNYYTPNNYVCGCVATMGAQIMRYWKWPSGTNITWTARWYGSVSGDGGWNVEEGWQKTSGGSFTRWSPAFGGTYDWSNMPLNPTGYYSDQNKAIGKLTRDVGLSCYMNYASGGSGTLGEILGHRFVDQFAYANAKIKSGWDDNAVLASIDAGMPCAVSVYNSSDSGHAIVGDGYGYDSSGTLYVHFNMGWGDVGADSTWYTTSNIDDTGYKFTSVEAIVYNIYPPSKGEADLTVVSGRVLNNGNAVGGVTVTAVNRETGVSYTATSSSGGTKSFNGETSAMVGNGIYVLMLPAGFYTISAESGSSSAKVERQVDTCLSEAWGKDNWLQSGRVGNIHGLDLNLGTAISAPAVALAHRWSFSGTTEAEQLADSVGSSAAEKLGSNIAISGGKAVCTGTGAGQGSFNLGENLLNTDAATIEIWAAQNAIYNGSRIFEYGTGQGYYFMMAWTRASDLYNDFVELFNNGAESKNEGTLAPYVLDRQYHISVTFERQPDGSTLVRAMKRDAASGALLRAAVYTMATGIHTFTNPILRLGRSFWNNADGNATYDEVRVWDGALTDAQLKASVLAGPDANLSTLPWNASAVKYVAKAVWNGGATEPTASSLANSDNWTCTDQNGDAITGVPEARSVVVIPSGGTTAFSIPSGFTPAWRKVQVGDDGAATMCASNATLNSSIANYVQHGANEYAAQLGACSIDTMQRDIIHSPTNKPDMLALSQLRFDGWFHVDSAKAGRWKLHGHVDDYIAFRIDDEWVMYGRTMGISLGAVDVAPGWHRYTMIVGDTGGGYGGCIVAGNHKKLTPMGVQVNGGPILAFSTENFTFATEEQQTVKLAGDADWRALGKITVDGAAIDLGGHELKIDTATASYLGSKVKNGKLAVYGDAVDTDNLILENVTVATEHAATPVSSPTAMTFYTDTTNVTLECDTEGASIYYTTDGSEPTKSSTLYSGPITLSGTTTIKAIAVADAYLESDVFTATFTQAPQAATPTGDIVSSGYRNTLVDLVSTVEGATIRYTTDGSDPTETSAVYDDFIDVTNRTGATTVKAVVFADGCRPSEVFTYDYYVKQFFGPTNGVNAAEYEDTPQNRAAHWIFENADYKEATGLWSNDVEYVDGKIAIEDANAFIADSPSDDRIVKVTAVISFNGIDETDDCPPDGDIKAAVRIGPNERFQVCTSVDGKTVWQDVSGIDPVVSTDYEIQLELDRSNKTYAVSAKMADAADGFKRLSAGSTNRFAYARESSADCVRIFEFKGEGTVKSIYGSYTNSVVFVTDEAVTVSDGTATLTASQADWLNVRGDHADVAAVIKTLTSDQFTRAYLLNENIMDASYSVDGWGSFKITDIAVGDDDITVKVKLVRNFAVMDGAKKAPINGTLKIYGGENVTDINSQIQDYKLSDNNVHFRDGEEATFIIEKGAIKFYKAKIEEEK